MYSKYEFLDSLLKFLTENFETSAKIVDFLIYFFKCNLATVFNIKISEQTTYVANLQFMKRHRDLQ